MGIAAALSCAGADSAARRPHRLPISRDDHDPEGPSFSWAVEARAAGPYLAAAGWNGGPAATTELPSRVRRLKPAPALYFLP